MHARTAWALAGLALGLVLADVVVSTQAVSLTSETAVAIHGFPFVHGAVVGSALMGALVVSRYPRHRIGWLLVVVGVAGAVSLLGEGYAFWVQESDGPGSDEVASIAAWIATLLGGQLEIALLALMFLLAPEGRLLSRRWRYAGWTIVAGALLCLLAIASMDPTDFVLVTSEDRLGAPRTVMLSVGFLAISLGMVAALVSMVLRLHRSVGDQRQQLRLIALSAALAVAGLVNMTVVQVVNGGGQTWASALPLFIAFFLLPILFAVAVLRHRLYELDVIINRTAVVVAATVFAAVGYTTLVVVVGSLVGRSTNGLWLSLLATALVAVVFQPVRRRVVRWANRLAYGPRAQPYEELADFSTRLVETPTSDRLLPAVAAAAGEALTARSATATLGAESAQWGRHTPPTDTHTVPVGPDGGISVALPRGRRLRAADDRLLHALADQAAVAFRNVALEAELATHVTTLDRTTQELARSRARLVEADDAVRRDLESAISREVLPHLVAVADGLRTGRPVTQLIDEVTLGLEALRDLTRGVFPTQLSRGGVEAALRAFPLTVAPALSGRRFPPRVEAAVYHCCTGTGATSAELAPSTLTLLGVEAVPQQVVDRVEAAGGSVSRSDGVVTVLLPDLA